MRNDLREGHVWWTGQQWVVEKLGLSIVGADVDGSTKFCQRLALRGRDCPFAMEADQPIGDAAGASDLDEPQILASGAVQPKFHGVDQDAVEGRCR